MFQFITSPTSGNQEKKELRMEFSNQRRLCGEGRTLNRVLRWYRKRGK